MFKVLAGLKNSKGKKIFADFALNFLAAALSTGVVQLLVYPFLAKMFDAKEYGLLLTVMGISNTIINTLGNSLNNVRLMVNSNYVERKEEGDFVPLTCLLSIIGFITMIIYLAFLIKPSILVCVLLATFTLVGVIRSYGVVVYRLKLDFKKNLICNFFIAIGNLVGIAIAYLSKNSLLWPLIFLIGEIFGIIILKITSGIFNESFRITSLFAVTTKKTIILIFTTLVSSVLIYLDRLILLPLLGGEAVSTYTTASFFGKCLGVVMTPMAAVLLGYYAQKGYVMNRKKFWMINSVISIIAAFFLLVAIIASKWITGIFYPTLISDAIPFLFIANLTSIIGTLGTMTQPAVLKFAPTFLQLVIQVGYCIIYLGGGLIGAKLMGLLGFSYAALIATISRVLALFAIGHFSLKS